jgi:hypothetical protein
VKRPSPVTIAALPVLLALVGNLATNALHFPESATPWLWVATFLLAIAAVVVEVQNQQTANTSVDAFGKNQLDDAADLLAEGVHGQWESEFGVRMIRDPTPLPVRWHPAESSLVDQRANIWLEVPEPLPSTGHREGIANLYRRSSSGRLIILGEAGAGKTVLAAQLALDLLQDRKHRDPVPVIVSVASWCPPAEATAVMNPGPEPFVTASLNDWLADQLVRDHVGLGSKTQLDGVTLAKALLDSRRILPILDGFDEIEPGLHRAALQELNATTLPMVVTSRTKEFGVAVAKTDVLARAPGIVIDDLTLSDLEIYLPLTVAGRRTGLWDGVLARLRDEPNGPASGRLLAILKTPLMVFLARTIYSDTPDHGDPISLLDTSTFETPDAIKDHLFERFIPTVYRADSAGSRFEKWNRKPFRKWLQFLAAQGGTDIEWWRLRDLTHRLLIPLSVGLIAGLAGTLGYPFPVDFGVGLMVAVVVGFTVRRGEGGGLVTGLAGGILGGLAGSAAAVALFGSGVRYIFLGSYLAGGLAFALAAAPFGRIIVGFVATSSAVVSSAFLSHTSAFGGFGQKYGLVAHLINGIGLGVAVGAATALISQRSPARGLRRSRLGLVCGIVFGVLVGFLIWVQVGIIGGLAAGLATTIGGAIVGARGEAAEFDLTKAATPQSVLVRDRATFLVSSLGVGAVVGLSTGLAMGFSPDPADGSPNGVRIGLGVGIANCIAVGLGFGFARASWGSFVLARFWLAMSRRLPWRLMAFLADAHTNRGALRQVGAAYQFRHVDLQKHLAKKGTEPP